MYIGLHLDGKHVSFGLERKISAQLALPGHATKDGPKHLRAAHATVGLQSCGVCIYKPLYGTTHRIIFRAVSYSEGY